MPAAVDMERIVDTAAAAAAYIAADVAVAVGSWSTALARQQR